LKVVGGPKSESSFTSLAELGQFQSTDRLRDEPREAGCHYGRAQELGVGDSNQRVRKRVERHSHGCQSRYLPDSISKGAIRSMSAEPRLVAMLIDYGWTAPVTGTRKVQCMARSSLPGDAGGRCCGSRWWFLAITEAEDPSWPFRSLRYAPQSVEPDVTGITRLPETRIILGKDSGVVPRR